MNCSQGRDSQKQNPIVKRFYTYFNQLCKWSYLMQSISANRRIEIYSSGWCSQQLFPDVRCNVEPSGILFERSIRDDQESPLFVRTGQRTIIMTLVFSCVTCIVQAHVTRYRIRVGIRTHAHALMRTHNTRPYARTRTPLYFERKHNNIQLLTAWVVRFSSFHAPANPGNSVTPPSCILFNIL